MHLCARACQLKRFALVIVFHCALWQVCLLQCRDMIPNKLHQELFSVRDTKHHQFFATFLLLFLVAIQPTSVQTQTTLNNFDCCAVKKVEGKYNLVSSCFSNFDTFD